MSGTSGKRVRIDVTSQQFSRLHKEIFSDLRLSEVQRRRAAREIVSLPSDGSPVDLYCDGKFVASL